MKISLKEISFILCVLFLFSCNGEKTCQCTTTHSTGEVVQSDPYKISVGECSDVNSSLEGITVDCIEVK